MQPAPFLRRALPLAAQVTGVTPLLLARERNWFFPSVRVVIYHSVPQACAATFEEQLQYYAKHYSNVTLADLDGLLNGGNWNQPKPGLIISFDDGMRSHAEVAAPLLEKYGFTGWFFVPTRFVDAPEETQREFARENKISLHEDLPGPRAAITWDQARELAKKHVVGGHTASHVRLSDKLTADDLEREIIAARGYLADKLDTAVDTFAWVGGEEWSYSQTAAKAIRDAGFRYSFMTNCTRIDQHSNPLQLDRCRIEPNWTMPMVRWQLSGIMDYRFAAKRRRVHAVTQLDE